MSPLQASLSVFNTIMFAGSAGATSWVQWKWSTNKEDKTMDVSLWHVQIHVQSKDDDNGNDMIITRREIDDEFRNMKAINANRGTTLTAMIFGLFPTFVFLYDVARNARNPKLELAGAVLWILAGVIAFIGSGYWEKRMESNSFLGMKQYENWADDYDEESHCHYGHISQRRARVVFWKHEDHHV